MHNATHPSHAPIYSQEPVRRWPQIQYMHLVPGKAEEHNKAGPQSGTRVN